jgi:nitrile hydratase subunit beta
MGRVHDVGGTANSAARLDVNDDFAGFHHEWEARVFAINRVLLKEGIYNLDEFRYATERIEPETYRNASYYERWLLAIETLLREKGLVP